MNGFKKDYFWNENNFIRRENCERFSLYCDLSAFELHSRFRALCNFFRAIRSLTPIAYDR